MKPCKLAIFLLTSVILFSNCQKKHDYNFTINGLVKNAPQNLTVKLFLSLPTGSQLIDSTQTNSNGQFTFKARAKGKNFYYITFSGKNDNIFLLADSGTNLTITLDYQNILNSYKIQGSHENQLLEQLEKKLFRTKTKIDTLAQKFIQTKEKGLPDSAKKIDSLIQTTLNEHKKYSINFIRKHYNSLVAIAALSQIYSPGKSVFKPLDDAQLYFMVDTALGRLYPDNPQVLRLHSLVLNIKAEQKRRSSAQFAIYPGAKAPDFTIKTIDNKTFTLNKTPKYVLLIFWSPWGNDALPALKAGLQASKNPEIQTLSICLSPDTAQVQKFFGKYPEFKQIPTAISTKLWSDSLIKKYQIRKLPTVILISPKNEILDINPDLKQIQKYITYK